MSAPAAAEFLRIVEGLDRLAVRQFVLVSDAWVARRLFACPCVQVGPLVSSPVVANCTMPGVDIVHAHDDRGGKAALLMALTRSIPYVYSARRSLRPYRLRASMRRRAARVLKSADLDVDRLLDIYADVIAAEGGASEFPEHADRR